MCLFVHSFSCLLSFIVNWSYTIHSCWMMLLKPVSVSTVKYPSASSSSNQVLLALMYCKHIELCSVLDTLHNMSKMLHVFRCITLSSPSMKLVSSLVNLPTCNWCCMYKYSTFLRCRTVPKSPTKPCGVTSFQHWEMFGISGHSL